MQVGIIGSSHSTGSHMLSDGSVTPTFISWMEKHKSIPMKFYSCANGGKGSEMFLNSIVHLKDTYDVDCILIELINNRRNINADIGRVDNIRSINSTVFNNTLEQCNNLNQASTSTFEYGNLNRYKAFIHEDFTDFIIDDLLYTKQKNNWKDIQLSIASNVEMMDYWTLLDAYQSLKLCKMLNIKTVLWQNRDIVMEQYTNYQNELQSIADCFVMFDNYTCSLDYFKNRFGTDIFADEHHIKPELEEILIRDFLMPAITNMV